MQYLSSLAGKLSLSVSFLFVVLFSLTVESAEARCDKTLTVHLDLHAPSAYLDSNGQVAGMDAMLAQKILTQAGCKVEWHLIAMTGERILRSLQQGKFDVMIRASKTVKRQEYAYFSEPYRDEIVGLFSRKQLELPPTISMVDALEQQIRLIGPVSGQPQHKARASYLALSLRWHPDKHVSAPLHRQVQAKTMFLASKNVPPKKLFQRIPQN